MDQLEIRIWVDSNKLQQVLDGTKLQRDNLGIQPKDRTVEMAARDNSEFRRER